MGRPREPIEERMTRHTRRDPSGCWLWTAYIDADGYGHISCHDENGRKTPRRAARVAYELEYGLIPEGLVIDHRCKVRACVRPDHLEVVTVKVNYERGARPAQLWGPRKFACEECGEPYEVLGQEKPERRCRACKNARQRGYYAAAKEAV